MARDVLKLWTEENLVQNSEYSRAALGQFAMIAQRLCDAIANQGELGAEAHLRAIHGLLPQAYLAVLHLPSTSVFSEGDSDSANPSLRGAPTHQLLAPEALSALADHLGPRRFYREVFDPYSEPSESEVTGDLIDDFFDIHHDLSSGLAEWRRGSPVGALWEWRFGFETHWGEHITSAMRALFALSAWHEIGWPEVETAW